MFQLAYIVVEITVFLLHKDHFFSAAVLAAEITLTIVNQSLKCEIHSVAGYFILSSSCGSGY